MLIKKERNGKSMKLHNCTDGSMRLMRIKEHPIKTEGNVVADDRMEMNGELELYENIGGSIYLSVEPQMMDNLVPIAGAQFEEADGKVKVKRLFNEFGYEEMVHILVDQLAFFSDFYGLVLEILDLGKR